MTPTAPKNPKAPKRPAAAQTPPRTAEEPTPTGPAARASRKQRSPEQKMPEQKVPEQKSQPATRFPRRDEYGRAISLAELTAGGLLGAGVALVAVVVIDGITALLGLGEFGQASGWLALILPALLYFDDLRGWAGYPVRFVVALVAAAAGIGCGLVVAGVATTLPPMISGALGAGAAVLVYSPMWFLGVRWLTGQAR